MDTCCKMKSGNVKIKENQRSNKVGFCNVVFCLATKTTTTTEIKFAKKYYERYFGWLFCESSCVNFVVAFFRNSKSLLSSYISPHQVKLNECAPVQCDSHSDLLRFLSFI